MAKLDKFITTFFIILFFVEIHNCNVLNDLSRDRRQTENAQNVNCQLTGNNSGIEEGGGSPWHVGLYNNTRNPPLYLCGGSLISQNVIITAAVCVTELRTGALLSKDRYSIAVGKHYREYNDPRDTGAQYRKLKQIYVMPSWHGESLLYKADIAILITDEILQLSPHVQPICMDYDGKVTQSVLQNPNPIGSMLAWDADAKLRDITLPYVEYDKCLQQLPKSSQKYLTSDKFCLGNPNDGSSVGNGISGNGIVLRYPKDNRFYLIGVADLSARLYIDDDDKKQSEYLLPTNVTEYARIIVEKANYHRVNE